MASDSQRGAPTFQGCVPLLEGFVTAPPVPVAHPGGLTPLVYQAFFPRRSDLHPTHRHGLRRGGSWRHYGRARNRRRKQVGPGELRSQPCRGGHPVGPSAIRVGRCPFPATRSLRCQAMKKPGRSHDTSRGPTRELRSRRCNNGLSPCQPTFCRTRYIKDRSSRIRFRSSLTRSVTIRALR